MCSNPEVFEWRVGPKVALQSTHKGRAPSMPKCTSARGDLWYGAKGCKVGGQLLHGLQQASCLGILATLHRLLQLVCAARVRVTNLRGARRSAIHKHLCQAGWRQAVE